MKLGFIGIGIMGLPIAGNILKKSGLPVLGFDIDSDRCRQFVSVGGNCSKSPEEIFKTCELVFLSLPNNDLVDMYINMAVKYSTSGTKIVDLSSSYPAIIRSYKETADIAGVSLIDCPVSGGEPKAIEGTLSAMCGGKKEDIEAVLPYLKMFNIKVTYMGELGCGYIAKLANNMIVGTEMALIAEAFNFAEKAGINNQVLFEAIRDGGAGSNVMDFKVPHMLDEKRLVSSHLSTHIKDQNNALALAKEIGAYTPLCAIATELMERMEKAGRGSEDVAAIIDIFKHETK